MLQAVYQPDQFSKWVHRGEVYEVRDAEGKKIGVLEIELPRSLIDDRKEVEIPGTGAKVLNPLFGHPIPHPNEGQSPVEHGQTITLLK